MANRFRELLGEIPALRWLTVLVIGPILTVAALFAESLPWAGPFIGGVLLWPSTLMSWIFPAPCFDRGPGKEPFCEGTPVQLFAGGLGLLIALVFYCGVAYLLVRRYSRPQLADRPPA